VAHDDDAVLRHARVQLESGDADLQRLSEPASVSDTGGNHVVGELIKDLTYAQIQTLDCGTRHPPNPAVDPFIGTQEAVAPTVNDTVDYVTFAQKVLSVIDRYGMVHRSLLQSFDWRTVVESKKQLPALKTVALAQVPTIFPGTPWTAGVPIRRRRVECRQPCECGREGGRGDDPNCAASTSWTSATSAIPVASGGIGSRRAPSRSATSRRSTSTGSW
jgi:hypothetical protein